MKYHNMFTDSGQGMEPGRTTLCKSSKKRAVKPSPSGEGGYGAACLPGLENSHGLHAAAIPWDPAEPIRWWVDTKATAKAKRILLMFGAEVILTSRDPKDYRRLLCEAVFRNTTPDGFIDSDDFVLTQPKPEGHHA